MVNKNNTAKNHHDDIIPRKSSRDGDEKRSSNTRRRTEQLDAFSAAIRPAENRKRTDRRRKRKTVKNIEVPQKQTNMNAVRFALRVSDVFWIAAIITLAVWNSYIGTNNRGIIAPAAAAILGMSVFISMLFPCQSGFRGDSRPNYSAYIISYAN